MLTILSRVFVQGFKIFNCYIDDTSLYIWSIILSLDANLNNIHKSVLVRITGGIALGILCCKQQGTVMMPTFNR
jgi:hypothetical protein